MQNIKINWIIIIILIVATAIVVIGTKADYKEKLSNKIPTSSTPPDLKQIRAELERLYSIADYDAPVILDAVRRAERTAKNTRYDKPGILSVINKIPKVDGEQYIFSFDSIPFDGIPVSESDIIVVGEILDKSAFVSNNKQGIYSEFNVRIVDIFKNSNANLAIGNQITFDRDGGFIRYGNGNKVLYRVIPFGMPQIGHLYILFLSKRDTSPNYYLLTGYELNQGNIINLDNFPQFKQYSETTNQESFIKAVRDAVQAAQSTPRS